MDLIIESKMSYRLDAPTDLLVQVEVARMAGQEIKSDGLSTTPVDEFRRIDGEQALGKRAWMRADGQFDLTYRAEVSVIRPDPQLAHLGANAARTLTSEATSFLMPSRYCPSDEFDAFVTAEFPGLGGGQLIVAMRDWIENYFTYVPGSSNQSTTARESFVQRRGVCRDYAHVLVTMARAAGIPARIVSAYAPHVDPPDFHAVTEVWLEDAWHLVDATGMAQASELAVIGVGRDAAEVSFFSSFGPAAMVSQSVVVTAA